LTTASTSTLNAGLAAAASTIVFVLDATATTRREARLADDARRVAAAKGLRATDRATGIL
jgi:hypothetical protein